MENQIELVQLPIIQHKLQLIGAEVSKRIDDLNIDNQLATDDTVKTLKEMRAELNKEATAFENQRKDVKNAIMLPYNDFEAIYKTEIIDKYKAADDLLKSKISEFELKIKTDKRNNLIDYFNEVCEFNEIDFLTFDKTGIEIGLSTSEKKYKEQILEFVTKVAEDITLIQTEQYAAEILIEYKNTLKASAAIANIRNRKEQEKIERERLLLERTRKRIALLQSLTFVYNEITKTYRFVGNDEIYINYSDVETLENGDWTKKYVELENAVKEQQKQTISAPKIEKLVSKPETTTPQPEAKKEEIFTATFEVSGTYSELTTLKNFLIENNYNYKNL